VSTQNNRRTSPGGMTGEVILLWAGILIVGAVVGSVWLAATLGHRLAGTNQDLPKNPVELTVGVFSGDIPWPAAGTPILAGVGVLLLAFLVFVLVVRHRFGASRTRVDGSARYLARGRDLAHLSEKGAAATAARLGVTGAPGVPIGRAVNDGRMLYGSWEDMHLDIWGPRTGKTTSRAIPAILAAPGAVLVTSNKRDIVDATRDVRAGHGPVWVFDPQAVAREDPEWWWNPLEYVTDEVKAAKLAEHFASGSREAGSKGDAYFDASGQDLLAGFLLAAALDGRPITDVYTWLTRPTNPEPAEILYEHGYRLSADQLTGILNAPDKQRGGIYGTAQQMASCLTNCSITAWVNPTGTDDTRPRFDPAAFVANGGTLYSLSREGKGTAGPLVTALTVAVVEAAEEIASCSAGGRLAVPLVGVLDEAANVCRWRELPNLYSHYGSRGIVLMTILQSWSQGVEVWGREGMRKLWSASNVAVYGGGVKEADFLKELEQLIGDYDRLSTSTSLGKGHRTVSQQLQRDRILDVAQLGAMPRGRALVIASGAPPALVRTVPWMADQHAEAVKASIKNHDPLAKQSLTELADTGTPEGAARG